MMTWFKNPFKKEKVGYIAIYNKTNCFYATSNIYASKHEAKFIGQQHSDFVGVGKVTWCE